MVLLYIIKGTYAPHFPGQLTQQSTMPYSVFAVSHIFYH